MFFAKVYSKNGIWGAEKTGNAPKNFGIGSENLGIAPKNLGIEVENLEIAPKIWDCVKIMTLYKFIFLLYVYQVHLAEKVSQFRILEDSRIR